MATPAPLGSQGAPLSEGYHVRDMLPSDARRTAELHREYLPFGLFPRLGRRFMTRWHETFSTSPHAWGGVVVGPTGDVVAVVLMTTDQHAYITEALTKHRWTLARDGAVGLLLDPRVLGYFLRTRALRYWRRLRRSHQPRTAAVTDRPDHLGVIHAVVTDESARGRGCARALLEVAEAHARRRGTPVLALITDDPAETSTTGDQGTQQGLGAAGMYDRLGWDRVGVHTRDGRRVAEYRRRLLPPEADDPLTNGETAR